MKNWIANHQGLLMSVAGAIVLGLLGGYADKQRSRADFFDKQSDILSDGMIIAREALSRTPEAAKLIDRDINAVYPNENNAPIEKALRYISKKAGLTCEGLGDDWETSGKTVTKEHRRIPIGE